MWYAYVKIWSVDVMVLDEWKQNIYVLVNGISVEGAYNKMNEKTDQR